ncbi:MAG TPA: xanthine dehydrogenase family protein subunit M [Burkholderiales bacterium]|nr:xanthine dehydrogenase family protein subunit M [Burkholderiales bacterium]
MKAPAFDYARPASLAEVFDLLEQHGDEAKLLAGGQTLMATLNMRLSQPGILIDITGLNEPALTGIRSDGGLLSIGALVRHREIERSEAVAAQVPLLAQAVPHVAHIAIRNAGTFGGSVAFADPAAEYPACLVALDATIVLVSRAGERKVAARDFFKALYETELRPSELVARGEIAVQKPGYRSVFMELARRHGDYAIVGIAAHGKVAGGVLSDVSLAYLGVGGIPVLARQAMAALEGQAYSTDLVGAAQRALAGDLDPAADLYSSGATKMHLARVLTGRALAALAEGA